MATTFLTSKERQEYDSVPDELIHPEVIQYFAITPDDAAEISVCRRRAHRFGFSLQLCCLRWLGRLPDALEAVPSAAIEFLSSPITQKGGVT